jgi:hypothetical protein
MWDHGTEYNVQHSESREGLLIVIGNRFGLGSRFIRLIDNLTKINNSADANSRTLQFATSRNNSF